MNNTNVKQVTVNILNDNYGQGFSITKHVNNVIELDNLLISCHVYKSYKDLVADFTSDSMKYTTSQKRDYKSLIFKNFIK